MSEKDPRAADAPTHPEASAGAAPDRASMPGAPRWVKVAALIGVVVVLLVVAILLIGGGDHGPDRHLGGTSSPAGHVPPAGGH